MRTGIKIDKWIFSMRKLECKTAEVSRGFKTKIPEFTFHKNVIYEITIVSFECFGMLTIDLMVSMQQTEYFKIFIIKKNYFVMLKLSTINLLIIIYVRFLKRK